MKKQKLAVVFAALLTMVGFSSCLNSEDDGIREWGGYFEVNNTYGSVNFVDPTGIQLVPNKTIIDAPASSALAYINYQYKDEDMAQIEQTKKLPVTLLQDPTYLDGLYPTSLPEETETVSFDFQTQDTDGFHVDVNGLVWGENKYLIMSPVVFLHKETTSDNLKEELQKHRLFISYDSEKDNVDNKTMKLFLRYQIMGVGDSGLEGEGSSDNETWAEEYSILYSKKVYIRLDNILTQYKNVHGGAEPEKIEVEYEGKKGWSLNITDEITRTTPTMNPDKKEKKTVTYDLYKDTSVSK